MDGIKLEKWCIAFEEQVKSIQSEYDGMFLSKKFEETWQLKPDETKHMLSLTVDEDLPVEIKEKMEKLFLATEPEDSV